MSALLDRLDHPAIARGAAALAAVSLFSVAGVHLLDGPESLSDQLYIGVLELALAAVCVPLAVMLLVRPTHDLWVLTGAIAGLALLVYVLSRTVGLPGSTDDIGNWNQTLGLANVVTELSVILLSAYALIAGMRAMRTTST